jgi:very-short-patch-repair endonuclease
MAPRRRWITYRRGLSDPTPAEKKLWYEFLRDLPYKFTRQKPLGHYVADFYCSRQQLVIELDGDSHYTVTAQRYERRRTAALELQGVRVARYTNTEVLQNFDSVCAEILAMLTEKPET